MCSRSVYFSDIPDGGTLFHFSLNYNWQTYQIASTGQMDYYDFEITFESPDADYVVYGSPTQTISADTSICSSVLNSSETNTIKMRCYAVPENFYVYVQASSAGNFIVYPGYCSNPNSSCPGIFITLIQLKIEIYNLNDYYGEYLQLNYTGNPYYLYVDFTATKTNSASLLFYNPDTSFYVSAWDNFYSPRLVASELIYNGTRDHMHTIYIT